MMNKISILIVSVFFSINFFGQTVQVNPTATQNYTHKIVYKKGYFISGLGSASPNDKIENIAYYDGLGKKIQDVAVRQGGKTSQSNDADLITHFTYDLIGRENKLFLSFANDANNGKYDYNPLENTNQFYNSHFSTDLDINNPNPYTEKEFEPTPLNRIKKQAFPGKDWKLGNGHEINFENNTNTLSTEVRLYTVSLSGVNPTLVNTSPYYYAIGKLYKSVVKDENHDESTNKEHTSEEFKDKFDRVILKRAYNQNKTLDTYYVYDDLGNLTFVLPPKSEPNLVKPNPSILAELCYQYKYDNKGRQVEKKLPGKEWEYIVYDNLDRVVMTQDANQRRVNSGKSIDEWLFTKYDAFDRVAYTGITKTNNDRATLQTNATTFDVNWVSKTNSSNNLAGTTIYYTNNGFPSIISEILTINYYDNYLFDNDGLVLPSANSLGPLLLTSAKGFETGSKVKILGTNSWITSIIGYDRHRRPVWVGTKNNYLNTIDYAESKLNGILDWIIENKYTHKKTGNVDIVIVDKFSYNHSGKLETQTRNINETGEESIVVNEYDDLGQLIRKKVGGNVTSELQVVDYNYNIRGWLTDINDVTNIGTTDLFAFKVNYNSPSAGTALYNGNISQTKWKTKSLNPNNPVSTSYTYTYDALNRITSAVDNTNNYSLTNVSYDKMGNIMTLQRRGHLVENPTQASHFGLMDNLSYDYGTANGNKLMKVTDAVSGTSGKGEFKDGNKVGDDFAYDANGSITKDLNKGITSILYNHLNMPTQIKFDNSNTKKINYTYTADGVKLRKVTNDSGNVTTTDYANNFIYENNTLKQFYHEEGYVEPSGNGYQYIYQYADIWGNVRLSYADADGNGTIAQSEIRREQNYYPGGLEQKGYNNVLVGAKSNFKTYQAQEFTEDLGLNTHEWRYRVSDPATIRFWQVDPLAEDYMYNSTFAFQENKFGMGIELEGLELVNWDMSFIDNVKLNFYAAKSFITSIAQTAEVLSNPIKTVEAVVGIGKAIASPIQTGKTIVNGVSQTVMDIGSTNPQVAGTAFGKVAAVVAETVVGAELANLAKVSKITTVADDVLPNSAKVVRGGTNTPELIAKGTGTHPSGVTGISVECGTCLVKDLAKGVPHSKVGVTTVGAVRKLGGDVIKTSGRSPNHATLTNLTAKQSSKLLNPVIKKPK